MKKKKNNPSKINDVFSLKKYYQNQSRFLLIIATLTIITWLYVSYHVILNNIDFFDSMLLNSITIDVVFLLIGFLIIYYIARRIIDNSNKTSDINSFLSSVLNSSNEIIIFSIDKNYRYTFFNKMHEITMMNLWGKQIKHGDSIMSIIDLEEDRVKFEKCVSQTFKGDSFSIQEEYGNKNLARLYWQDYYSPIYSKDNKVIGCTCFCINVTPLVLAEKASRKLSYLDGLTNLYNRRYFQEIKNVYDLSDSLPLSVIIADINGLKFSNDIFGHNEGDRLILSFTEILRNTINEENIIARLGGDEFAVILPNTNKDQVDEIIKKCESAIMNKDLGKLTLSVSFGAATKTLNDESIEQIIEQADSSMYHDKMLYRQQFEDAVMLNIADYFYTNNHIERTHAENTSKWCLKIGSAMKLNNYQLAILENAGYLHDIGKVALNYQLLVRRAPTYGYIAKTITQHCEAGFKILNFFERYKDIATTVLSHHEQPDGKGYPSGLTNDEIPPLSMIVAVANAYDVMTSKSFLQKPMTEIEAINELLANRNTKFDAKIVDIFVEQVLNFNVNKQINSLNQPTF